jgi:hypothetical protein
MSLLAIAGLLVATSCSSHGAAADSTGPIAACSATRPIAIAVSVRDSVSGRAIADSAGGTARTDVVVDTLVRADSLTLLGGERLGVYDVAIQRPGYRSWARLAVQVMNTGACGNPQTVTLNARLQPLP